VKRAHVYAMYGPDTAASLYRCRILLQAVADMLLWCDTCHYSILYINGRWRIHDTQAIPRDHVAVGARMPKTSLVRLHLVNNLYVAEFVLVINV
jgi:hypothetical protein